MFSRFSIRTTATLVCFFGILNLLFLQACNKDSDKNTPAQPWTFSSELARYEVTLPPTWKPEADAKNLNAFADLAANLDNTLFLIVIPQKLPVFPVPDARAVKSAGLEMMQNSITDLRIKRQGDIILDDVSGVSVFFEGTVESERIQYIATYMTQVGWGYQIIAWGPATAERRLIEEVDQVLAGWKFLERDPTPARPDAPSVPIRDDSEAIAEIPLDTARQEIIDSLENIVAQSESVDSMQENSDQEDESGNENTKDLENIDENPLDTYSEGN